ncbi:MAG: S26 family signal peptidase [Desulfobulbaceae bacterium]
MAMRSISANGDKRLFRRLRGREKAIALVVLAALLVGVWLPERIIVATSASLDYRVFFLVPASAIKSGDYLVFRHSDATFVPQGLNRDNNRLIKRVGCGPGETLTSDGERQFFCNGILLATALDRDSKGQALPRFHYSGTVPAGSFFMVGSNPRSFDSKYFGFINVDEILYKALPLW